MSLPRRAPALAVVLAFVAGGCQDYNFNPVGHCLIQPGAERFTLSNISTADVLFVVDDSGSMGDEQGRLADAFGSFISNLDATNAARASGGLQPIDFHIAVTSSSVYWNLETGTTCLSGCAGAGGQLACCASPGQPAARRPQRCSGAGDASCPAPTSCRLDCSRHKGQFYCCNAADGSIPPAALTELVTCSREGIPCGALETHLDFPAGCSNTNTPDEWPHPQGDFVSHSPNPLTTLPNPRVLHFDKELYTGSANKQGFTSTQLRGWFTENIKVGTCGSGQEQALQAARLAIQKAFGGQQKDTRTATGAQAWTAPTGTALNGPSAAARWPNPNSKLVVVFVGDEDDCSGPQDPSGGVVMINGQGPGVDACSRDEGETLPLGKKEFPVSEFVSFLTGLGRPVAAAFILPAAQNACSLASCTTDGLCGGAQAPGHRLLRTAQALEAAGVEVVAGSICDPNFDARLNEIAEIVKPPQTLSLPTEPAESRIALLRIVSGNGDTRKLCGAPLGGSYPDLGAAQATGADWWFTQTNNPGPPFDPTGTSTISVPTKFVYINPNGSCRANPGETYSADYLGVLPDGGCFSDTECADKLGGQTESWECFQPMGTTVRGTCTCRENQ